LSKLDISGNRLCGVYADWGGEQGTYDTSGLVALTKSIGNLKELSISNNFLKAEGAKALVPALEANGSLASLDLSKNALATKEAGAALGSMLKTNTTLKTLNLSGNNAPGARDGAGLASRIAMGLKANGSLSKLTWSGENYGYSDGNGEQQAPPVTLDTTMTEADFSGKKLGAAGAQIFAAFMSTKLFQAKGSLFSLTFCGNGDGDAVTINTAMTEADFSGKKLGAGGAQVLAAFMSTKLFQAKGSLSSVNLLKNYIPVEQAQEFVKIKESMQNLQTLCGLAMEETELDLSGQDLRAGDAVLIASDISDMGSLVSLNLASNMLGVEGAKRVAEVLPKW
jgi:hypothetical protein